ncbi:uncharacterized protein LOC144438895 [Glandiceps talaboti]
MVLVNLYMIQAYLYWTLVITSVQPCSSESSVLRKRSTEHCYPACSAGEYCETSSVCEKCSCCCQDQIDLQNFVPECTRTSKPYDWCKVGTCPSSNCVHVPTSTTQETTSLSTPSSTVKQNITSVVPTVEASTTHGPTTNATTNVTQQPNPSVIPHPNKDQMTKGTKVGIVCGGIVVAAIAVICLVMFIKRWRRKCGKSCSAGSFNPSSNVELHSEENVIQYEENTNHGCNDNMSHADNQTRESVPTNEDLETQSTAGDSQSSDETRATFTCNPSVDDSGDGDGDNYDSTTDSDTRPLIKEVKKGKPSKKQKHKQLTTIADAGVEVQGAQGGRSDISQSGSKKECTFTIQQMMDVLELIDNMSHLLDVPVSGRKGASYLGYKFANLTDRWLNYLAHHCSAERPLTKMVLEAILKKNTKLKCVEIVQYLQEELRMNDVVLEIQKYHGDCEACKDYYDRI